MKTEVLIIGAGPSGLVLALWLRRLGVRVRIIDKSDGPGETSRALAVQARTLEFHRQVGIVNEVLAAGTRLDQFTIHTPAGIAARPNLTIFGEGLSKYPFAFALPQDIHERILVEHLEKAGVRVDRETELVSFAEHADGISATLRCEGKDETVKASYIAGCDGAHSTVRHALGIGFPGGAYNQIFYVTDVEGTGPVTPNGMDIRLAAYGFALLLPVRQSGSLRLVGIVPKEHEADKKITFESIRYAIERDSGIKISAVNWFSTYRVHHRVAERFKVGRAFIVGDAGHVHSPAGGQGMNTGMGDAVNLAWKLAAVVQGRADPKLLDSYEPERIAFARRLIATTDKAFRLITSSSKIASLWRQHVLPRVVAAVLRTKKGSNAFFRMNSQIGINYRGSAVSLGLAGKVRGGDRLPWVSDDESDNHAPLASLDWQVHVYGAATPTLTAALVRLGLALHIFPWTAAAARAGLARGAAYLVRPDGHVALADAEQSVPAIEAYLASLRIVPRSQRVLRTVSDPEAHMIEKVTRGNAIHADVVSALDASESRPLRRTA